MSDPRSTDSIRRYNRQGAAASAAARANPAASSWTTVWTWLAAIAAVAVILGLVFGYSRSDLVRTESIEPATAGSAPGTPAPLTTPRIGSDAYAPAPAAPADDQ
jgi:hypothetical protein